MGQDKAFLSIGGRPLVARVAEVLDRAGARRVVVIGGDEARLRALGLEARSDRYPGEGPLGGLLTGLEIIETDIAFVTACDHPTLDPELPRRLVEGWSGSGALACVPVSGGVWQVLAALYHRDSSPALAARFASGERSLRRALAAIEVCELPGCPPVWFADLDTPVDVENYAARHEADDNWSDPR